MRRIHSAKICPDPKRPVIPRISRYEPSPEALAEAGIAYAAEQIIDLLSWGVDGIHLYTMNRPDISERIMGSLLSVRDTLTGR